MSRRCTTHDTWKPYACWVRIKTPVTECEFEVFVRRQSTKDAAPQRSMHCMTQSSLAWLIIHVWQCWWASILLCALIQKHGYLRGKFWLRGPGLRGERGPMAKLIEHSKSKHAKGKACYWQMHTGSFVHMPCSRLMKAFLMRCCACLVQNWNSVPCSHGAILLTLRSSLLVASL